MYLLSVSSVSSRYFNKTKRTSYLGKLPALSLEILAWLKLKLLDLTASFEMAYISESRKSLDLYVESKFCKCDVYFLKRRKNV